MGRLRFRQVHLDFHTSADCEGVDDVTDGRTVGKVYLAPEGEPLDFEVVDGYARIALPPVGAHAVIIVEKGGSVHAQYRSDRGAVRH